MSHRPRRRTRAWAAALLAALAIMALGMSMAVSARPAPPASAHVVAEERVGPRLVDLTIQSPALGTTARVRLLTPEGWERRSRGDGWPVLYLLHGVTGSHTDWTDDSDVEELPQLRNVLVVMPDAEDGFYSDWWNYGAGGPPAWETFHLNELRGILERKHGAGNRRAVAGLSMGGYGAFVYAARHPGMFRAAASYSGTAHLLHPAFLAGFRETIEPAREAGVDLLAMWGDPVAQRHIWEEHDPYHMLLSYGDSVQPAPRQMSAPAAR